MKTIIISDEEHEALIKILKTRATAGIDDRGLLRSIEDAETLQYDPIGDEHKLFTLDEWVDTLCSEVRHYGIEWRGSNRYHVEKHTWSEWMGTFARYMSW